MRCPGPYETRISGYPAAPKTIGEHIRKRRLDQKLRQAEVAEIIGCDELSVVNWEKGHTRPSVNHMTGVVRFLGFNPLPSGVNLAQRLVYHRMALGVTQNRFAARIGVDPSTLAKWERGQRQPSDDQIRKLRSAGFGHSCASPFGATVG